MRDMRIYVLGSNHFMKEMVECKNRLCAAGYDAWIHPDYESYVNGGHKEIMDRWRNGERAALKREYGFFHQHYRNILASDAVLFVNLEKNGIKNYIGGNVLIEMGQAYVNHKKIFFLNGMPGGLPYMDEIEAMDPVCLNGNFANIA